MRGGTMSLLRVGKTLLVGFDADSYVGVLG